MQSDSTANVTYPVIHLRKEQIGFALSSLLIFIGIILRLSAQALAWPSSYSYSGTRGDSVYGHTETAIAQVAFVLMCLGGLALIVTYVYWLFKKDEHEHASSA